MTTELRVNRFAGICLLFAVGCRPDAVADSNNASVQPNAAAASGTVAVNPAPQTSVAGQGSTSRATPSIPAQNVGGSAAGTSATAPTVMASPSGNLPAADTGGVLDMRGNWMSFGGDPGHTRAVMNETTISLSNAAMLGTAFDIKAPGVTSTPAVYKGIVYWGDWGGTMHATELPVGKEAPKEKWKVDRTANKGGYSNSLAVTERVVVGANRNGLVTAVDRDTGMQLWEIKLDAGPHTYIWSSPVIAEADNVIVIGMGGAGTRDNGIALPASQTSTFHGSIIGLDFTTGKQLWQFYPSPEPMGAGCSVWSSGALDLESQTVFIGVGNNYERPTSDMADALIALDYKTGTKKWHHQFTKNDAFTTANSTGGVDGDVGATPNLFKIGERAVVGVGDKPAGYHVFDRETGELIWEVEKLTSSSGFQGGVMQPATIADGKVFVISNNSTISSKLFVLDQATGKQAWTADLGAPTFGGSVYGNGVIYTVDSDGNIKAFDAAKGGAPNWKTRMPTGVGGGFSLVDGMLFLGYGYHFTESAREPLMGGLMGFAIGGSAPPPPTGPVSDCMPGSAVTSAATFTNVYQGVLCANGCDKVCHTSNTGAAQLGLMGKSMAYKNLVGVNAMDAMGCGGKGSRVLAGNAEMSVLYQKLANTQTCGSRMPPGGPVNGDIPAAQLDALKAWINAGAPDN